MIIRKRNDKEITITIRVLIICLLDLFVLSKYTKLVYKFYFTSTVDFLIYFSAYNFKRIYAFELYIFLLQKLHGWIEIEIFYTKILKNIWIYEKQLSNLTFSKL